MVLEMTKDGRRQNRKKPRIPHPSGVVVVAAVVVVVDIVFMVFMVLVVMWSWWSESCSWSLVMDTESQNHRRRDGGKEGRKEGRELKVGS
jgi:hypothetical protein